MQIKMLETVIVTGNEPCKKGEIIDIADDHAKELIAAKLAVEHVESEPVDETEKKPTRKNSKKTDVIDPAAPPADPATLPADAGTENTSV